MKKLTQNQELKSINYNNDKLTCNHSTIDVSKYGLLKCLCCDEYVTNFQGSLESESQKRIRIDLSNVSIN